MAFSGGKDSVVLLDLVRRSGVKHDAHYNITTIDPPELVRFIRSEYPEVNRDRPKRRFFASVPTQGLPTRLVRWCCRALKEWGGAGRICLMGMRAAESNKRAHYQQVVIRKDKTVILPILNWSTDDVWAYIREQGLPYCSLYDEGLSRLGCVICPMQRKSEKQQSLVRWPKLWAATKRAAEVYYNAKRERGTATHDSFDEYWNWWLWSRTGPTNDCQMNLLEV